MSPADQLAEAVESTLHRLSPAIGFGWVDQLLEVAERCAGIVAELQSGERLAAEACVTVGAICDTDEDGWWTSPLGVLVARSQLGDVDVSVTHAEAAEMLGVQRGGIGGMVTKGMLVRHVDGGVSRRSVLARIARER